MLVNLYICGGGDNNKRRDGDNNGSNSISGFKVKESTWEKPILVLLSNSYSELKVLVNTSRPSACSTLYHLLATYRNKYYSNWIINYFDLKRLFYSRQDFYNTHYSSVYNNYNRSLAQNYYSKQAIYYVYTR